MNRFRNHLLTAAGLVILAGILVLSSSNSGQAEPPNPRISPQSGNNPPLTVQVSNTAATPLFVRDVASAPSQPVQARGSCRAGEDTVSCRALIFEVPEGKRLVIEYASMITNFLSAGDQVMWAIETSVGGVDVEHFLPESPRSSCVDPSTLIRDCIDFTRRDDVTVFQPVRLYADPGTSVFGFASKESTVNPTVFRFHISGYLVDVP